LIRIGGRALRRIVIEVISETGAGGRQRLRIAGKTGARGSSIAPLTACPQRLAMIGVAEICNSRSLTLSAGAPTCSTNGADVLPAKLGSPL
jgi:hypothetical protein